MAKTRTMSHIVGSCPLTKSDGNLSRIHSADDDDNNNNNNMLAYNAPVCQKTSDAVVWLASLGR